MSKTNEQKAPGDFDPGERLRSLYEPDGGVREVFSSKVADYVASRPGYPDALFNALAGLCDLPEKAMIADVGAGTGLFSRGLLERGYRVAAIEPNAAMRQAAQAALSHYPGYQSLAGSAESIPLGARSVDLITAAQAFHWFEVEAARTECLRVLTDVGQVALVWNDRAPNDPLEKEFDTIFAEFGGEKRAALVAHEDRADVPVFFGGQLYREFAWPNEHVLDESGLASLFYSRSYMPERASKAGQAVLERARALFKRSAVDGHIVVRYRTIAMIGRPQLPGTKGA
ncbi:MAG: class I SAM-dependent methyltransferase [Burkholderiaceae bacterium]|jgi:SAM-dependent methyltransferase